MLSRQKLSDETPLASHFGTGEAEITSINPLKTNEKNLIFKVPYSPRGVKRQDITAAFHESGLAELIPDRRLICAQLRSTNIRDRVSRTALADIPGDNPSDYIGKI